MINASAIVLGFREAIVVAGIMSVVALTISFFHTFELYIPITDQIDSHPINTLVLCFFLWINVNIARIGYQQIEHSYNSAIEYSNKLEAVNKNLDKMVDERTFDLKKSWKERVRDLEKTATVGHISSTLLHDLKTPLSSMAISMELFKDRKNVKDKQIRSLERSFDQIVELIDGADALMNNHEIKENFSIDQQLKLAVSLVKTLTERENIDIRLEDRGDVQVFGQKTLFLRVILNLIVNSIEELSQIEQSEKEILISVRKENKKAFVTVRDNGNGIPEDEIEEVFDSGFGSKHGSKHYGLGLSFVKQTVENDFLGDVEILSTVGEFTDVTIKIPAA